MIHDIFSLANSTGRSPHFIFSLFLACFFFVLLGFFSQHLYQKYVFSPFFKKNICSYFPSFVLFIFHFPFPFFELTENLFCFHVVYWFVLFFLFSSVYFILLCYIFSKCCIFVCFVYVAFFISFCLLCCFSFFSFVVRHMQSFVLTVLLGECSPVGFRN